jgi:hypothetical protein
MIKSGFKTSEYIPVVASMITFILVTAGVIRPEQSSDIESVVAMGVSGIVAFGLAIAYIFGRIDLKKSAVKEPEIIG